MKHPARWTFRLWRWAGLAALAAVAPWPAGAAPVAPDPCSLVTAAELQPLVGALKGRPSRSGGPGAATCEFTLAQADGWVEIGLHDGDLGHWKKRNGGKAPQAQPEFGADAFVNPDFEGSAELYAKKGTLALRVSMPKGPAAVEALKAVARKALTRL